VLDHLDDGRRAESCESTVPVRQRGLEEPHALALPRRQAVEPKACLGDLQSPVGDVDTDDLLEGGILEQRRDQLAAPAADVEDAPRAGCPEHRYDGAESLLVQAHWLLDRFLLGLALLPVPVGVDVLVCEKAGERLARGRALVLQVAVHDQLALGRAGKPALAATHELLDLLVPDPVVLLRVEDGDEHVEVREQLAQA
jgi:hypothetical protein